MSDYINLFEESDILKIFTSFLSTLSSFLRLEQPPAYSSNELVFELISYRIEPQKRATPASIVDHTFF